MRFVSWKVASESGTELSAPEVVDQEELAACETGNKAEKSAEMELEPAVASASELEVTALMLAEAVALAAAEEEDGEAEDVADSVVTNVENLDLLEAVAEAAVALELDVATEALEET